MLPHARVHDATVQDRSEAEMCSLILCGEFPCAAAL